MKYGTCSKCDCTDDNACTHPDHGTCWWVDNSHELCSHCMIDEIRNDPLTKHPEKETNTDKCKISDPTCIYHACMSDDCQKNVVLSNGQNWGSGKCEKS